MVQNSNFDKKWQIWLRKLKSMLIIAKTYKHFTKLMVITIKHLI